MSEPGPRDTIDTDDYPRTEVPQGARRGAGSLLVVLLGFVFFAPTMLSGARLATALPTGKLAAVLLAGSLILGGYVAVLGLIGARTGLTTVLLARFTLGGVGAKWAALLLGGTQVAWYAVTAAFLAELVAEAFAWQDHTWLIILVGSALTGVTAYFGYRGMSVLSGVSVPLMLLVMGWVAARAVREAGGVSGLVASAPDALPWATAVTVVVGTFVSGGTQTPNWSRFARLPWQAFAASLGAFVAANLLMLVFGGMGALAFGEGDFVAVLLQLNLTGVAVLLLVLNIWTTQDNAAYAFGVAGAEFFGVDNRRLFVLGGVAVAVVLALSGIYAGLEEYLILLGVLIPPLGGVIIGDYVFVWRGRLPRLADTRFLRFRWGNVAAYALGTAVAWTTGELAWGLPPMQGIVAALLAVPLFDAALRRCGVVATHKVTATPAAAAPSGPPS